MKSFSWGKHFETGLFEVDKQHRQLVDTVNEFSSLFAENKINISDVNHIYNQLAEYAVYHFQTEEKMMKQIEVDSRHFEHHVRVHKNFLEDVTYIHSTISMDNLEQASSFLKFLIHWLAYHILGEDQDMANQVKAIQSGANSYDAYQTMEQTRDSATLPLVEALNGLFEQMSMRNKELQELNDSLEEKVSLRTKELCDANKNLKELSLTDVLTGLPNRRHAMRRLSIIWDESLKNNSPLVCMMIDADHFKAVNDTHGHSAGDEVLIELAKSLQYALRSDDIVCRLGGDEFFVICPNTDKKGGLHIAELTCAVVASLRVPSSGEFWKGSVSIGVAVIMPGMENFEDLIKAADKAVYVAKESGRGCVKFAGDA